MAYFAGLLIELNYNVAPSQAMKHLGFNIIAGFCLWFFSLSAYAESASLKESPYLGGTTYGRFLSFSLYSGVYFNGYRQNFAPSATSSEFMDRLKNMYLYGLRVGHPFNSKIEAEIDFMYSPTKSGGFELFAYYTSIHGVLNVPINNQLVPYFVGGPGVLTLNIDQISTESKLGLGFGAGLKLFVSDRFAFRPEARGVATFSDFNIAFLGSLMLTYYTDFSRTKQDKDFDHDGIVDRLDRCPKEPETINGYEDEDGCPDSKPIPKPIDTDGDGIIDQNDKCPTEKETINGFQDEDGCPDVIQQLPKAFVEPKKVDTDGDGIMDDVDQCIKEPETVNSYKDNDGCPDTVPEELKPFSGVIEGIFFAVDSTIIERESYKKLDQAVAILKKYNNLTVLIEGHTDSTGSASYNLKLSKERAESVRQYLTSRGVSLERLSIKGYGFSKPIASNSTSTGRAQNRRIEFKIQEKAPKKKTTPATPKK
ncbi:MAG: OmpA family protein [Bdellovibrionales bacterium]|nr:OmpA family protein [Bdellovibrionales bacterium]